MNLLPLTEKKKVRTEYRFRLYTVLINVLIVLFLAASVPLIISYFAIANNVNFINEVAESLSKSEGFKKTDALAREVKEANLHSAILATPIGVTARENITGSFSSVFTKANEIKNAGNGTIKINQIIYEYSTKKTPTSVVAAVVATSTGGVKESGSHKISIRGFASSRDAFLLFLKETEKDKNFLSIDSPVSNLVNSQNLDFSLNITLRDKAI